jgi:hypothetical protein
MLARQGVMTCSYRCGRIHRNGVYEQRRASKERPTEMPREEHRADDDHPEVIALRAIERALRALPDQTARERVLDYARGWCVSVERAKPNGAIVAVEQQDLHADG